MRRRLCSHFHLATHWWKYSSQDHLFKFKITCLNSRLLFKFIIFYCYLFFTTDLTDTPAYRPLRHILRQVKSRGQQLKTGYNFYSSFFSFLISPNTLSFLKRKWYCEKFDFVLKILSIKRALGAVPSMSRRANPYPPILSDFSELCYIIQGYSAPRFVW